MVRCAICYQVLTLLHGCFSHFLNCTNGTKSRNAPHLCFKALEKKKHEMDEMGTFPKLDRNLLNAC